MVVNNGKTGWKVAVLKVVGTVIVALLGLVGAGLGYLAQVQTGNTDDALKATVEHLNTRTIPLLETLLKEQREETRKVREKLSTACERLAYVEALTRQVAEKTRTKMPLEDKTPTIRHGMVRVMSVDSGGELKEPDLIPRLDMQQIQQKAE